MKDEDYPKSGADRGFALYQRISWYGGLFFAAIAALGLLLGWWRI